MNLKKVMSISLLMTFIVLFTQVQTLPAQTKPKIKILISRAGEASSAGQVQNGWFSALSEAYYYFRFDPLETVKIIPRKKYSNTLSTTDIFGVSVSEVDIFHAARELDATHVLIHTYDLDPTENIFNYYLEVLTVDKKVVVTFDESFAPGDIEKNLDACTKQIIKNLLITPSSKIADLLTKPILVSAPNILMELGNTLVEAGDKANEKDAKKLLKISDDNIGFALATYRAAQAFKDIGDCDNAAKLFNRVMLRNRLPYSEIYLQAAMNYRKCQSYDEAEKILSLAESNGISTHDLLVEKALILEKFKRVTEARNIYDKIILADPDQPDALLFLARQQRESGSYKKSLEYLNRYIKLSDNPGPAYIEMGLCYVAMKNNSQALSTLQKATSLLPDEPEPNMLLGDLYFDEKKYENAAAKYAIALEKMSSNLDLLLKTADSYSKSNDPEKALQILNKYKANFFATKQVSIEIGLLKFQLKDTTGAQEMLESCLLSRPPDSRVFLAMGDIYAAKGQRENAIRMYEQADPLLKDKTRVKISLANLQILNKDYDNAQKNLNAILSTNPNYPNANGYLADILMIKGQNQQALKHYLKERELQANNIHLQKNIAQIYFQLNNHAMAEKESKELLTLDPVNATGYQQLALIALKNKKPSDAKNYIAQAEVSAKGKIDPSIYETMGKGFAAINSWGNAIESYKNYLKSEPKNEAVWIELANVYFKAKKDTGAAHIYAKIYELNPQKNKDYLAKAGHTFYSLGMKRQAYNTYEKFLLKGFIDPLVNVNCASIEFANRKFEKTISLLEDKSGKYATDKDVIKMLAYSYHKTKKHSQALQYVKKHLAATPDDKKGIEIAALEYEKAGDINTASGMYLKYLSLEKNREYSYHLGTLYEKLKQSTNAITQYKKNIADYPDDFRSYERLAELYLDSKQYESAMQMLTKVTANPSADPVFFRKLAEVYAKQNKTAEAADTYEKYLINSPKDSKTWFLLGSTYYEKKNYAKAITPLMRALELEPENMKCLAMIGHSYHKMGKMDDAFKTYSEYHRRGFKDPEVNVNLATMEFKNKNYSKTISLLKNLTGEFASDPKVNRMLALSHNRMGTHSLAATYIKNLVLQKPNDPEVIELAALTYEKTGDSENAAAMFKKYIELPKSTANAEKRQDYSYRMAMEYEKQKQIQSAITQYQKNITGYPKDFRNYERLGLLYLESKQYTNSIPMLEKASSNPSVTPEIPKKLADLYMTQKEFTKAANIYEKYLSKIGTDAKVWFELGKIYYNEKSYEKAVKPLNRASELMPQNSNCLALAGHAYFHSGKSTEANKIYNDFLGKGFKDLEVNVNLAAIEFSNKKYTTTISLLKNLTGTFATDPKTIRMLAVSHSEMGTYSLAVSYIKKLVTNNPNDPEAIELAALTYDKTGDAKSAALMYEKYCSLPKEKVDTNKRKKYAFHLAEIFEKQNQTSLAIAQYKKNTVDFPKDFRNYDRLGDLYLKSNNYTNAVVMLEMSATNPSVAPELFKKLAELYEKQKNNAKAADTYEKYLLKMSNDSKAWYALGNIYYLQKAYDKALIPFRRASELMPQNKECLALTGHTYYELGKKTEASKIYNDLISKEYKDPQINVNLAKMEYENKNYSKATTLLKTLPSSKYTSDAIVTGMLAFSYFNEKKYSEALPYVKQLLLLSPQDIKVVELAAITYEKTNNNSSASDMYKKYLSFKPTKKHKEYAYRLGTLYEKQRALSSAITQYKSNLSKYPNDLRNHDRLAQLYMDSKNYTEAIKVISTATTKSAAPPSLNKKLAEIYTKQGKNSLAASSYEKYLKNIPTDSMAFYELGTIYYSLKAYKKAIFPLESASVLMPINTACLYKLGDSYAKAGDPKKAITPLQKAHSIIKNDKKILSLLTQCYADVKDTNNLIIALKEYTVLEPDNFTLQSQLGNILLKTGQTDLAISALEAASKIKPSDVTIHISLISLYKVKKNTALLLNHFNSALRFAPKNADLHFEKALFHLDAKELNSAKISLLQTIKLRPDHDRAHFEYGTILKNAGQNKTAFHHFGQAAKYSPKNPDYLLSFAQTAIETGNNKTAQATIIQAIKIKPNDPALIQWAGYIYFKSKDFQNAQKYLVQGMKLDKNCPFCHELLGSIYFANTDYNAAVNLLEKASSNNPTNDSIMVMLGDALAFTNQLRRGLVFYSKAFAINPKDDKTYYKVCAAKIDLGMPKEAEAVMNSNKGRKKTPWVHLAQARILEANNNPTVAEFSYNAALRSMPNNSDAHLGMGRICLTKKKYNKAVEHFSMAMIERPDEISIFVGMGRAYYGLANYTASMELLSDALKKDPNNHEANMYLGLIYNKRNKHEKAITLFEKSLAREPKNPNLHFMLAVEYGRVLRVKESIDSFLKVLKYDETKAIVVYKNVGDLYYYKIKDQRKAKKYYEKYIEAGGTSQKVKTLINSL